MFKIDNWEIELSTSFESPVTLFENSNKVIAVQKGNIIAVFWKVPNGLMRIDSYGVAIAFNETKHIIHLAPKMTLDEILIREVELEKTNNT